MVVQWLRLFALNAGGLGSIPGQGTRSYMPQLRPRGSQINKNKNRLMSEYGDHLFQLFILP